MTSDQKFREEALAIPLRSRHKGVRYVMPDDPIPRRGEFVVYRHYDLEGVLLYVGASMNFVERQRAHCRSAHWRLKIDRCEVRRYRSMATARAYERRAIVREFPRHNVLGVPK